ncbi:SAM-dependent methyltransferase [Aquihabitans daechungensis]|uniref:SAM-dependent methyltransferase n=1 Tax=Aquihabitans daechungensis TaxID=1052257 RepID=UPI003BA3A1B0
MRKTSVYLTDELKEALAEAAGRSGRSEADFIRGAIELAVQQTNAGSAAPVVEPPRRQGPLLVGVGVGAGASDLLTPRARTVIAEADTVVAAAISPDAIGRAEAVARAGSDPLRVVRLEIDVSGNEAERSASFDAAATTLVAHLDRREVVAFLTIGDPSLFSVFPRLADAVRAQRPETPVQVVPGIAAFQELAAASGTVIGHDHQSIRIVNVSQDPSEIDGLVEDTLGRADETLVLYRGGRGVPGIAAKLADHRRLEPAVVGELLGQPGARVSPASEFVDGSASYLACLIAPAAPAGSRRTQEPAS